MYYYTNNNFNVTLVFLCNTQNHSFGEKKWLWCIYGHSAISKDLYCLSGKENYLIDKEKECHSKIMTN